MHQEWDYGPGFEKEFTLENGKRADAVNLETREVVELKPNNPRAIARGTAQARGYAEQLSGDLRSTMSERDAVQLAFDRFGKEAGFEKKSGSWYRRGDEVIAVSNLQKSQYGPQYYFNQGFWLTQVADERFPKELKCHIRARLGSLLPDASSTVEQLLDLEHEMPDEQRIDELVTLLNDRLLPLIERGSSVAGLRALLDEGTFKAAGIRGPAQEALAAAQ